jgi:hypothetical protein
MSNAAPLHIAQRPLSELDTALSELRASLEHIRAVAAEIRDVARVSTGGRAAFALTSKVGGSRRG